MFLPMTVLPKNKTEIVLMTVKITSCTLLWKVLTRSIVTRFNGTIWNQHYYQTVHLFNTHSCSWQGHIMVVVSGKISNKIDKLLVGVEFGFTEDIGFTLCITKESIGRFGGAT